LWQDTLLLCLENAGESFAVGIDTKTGENRWRLERPRGINWVTPLVIGEGKSAAVLFHGPKDPSAHGPAAGREPWGVDHQKFATISSPTFGDGMVYASGEKFLALRPGSAAEKPEVVWQSAKHPTGYSSAVHYQGKLYTVSSAGIVNCSDAASGGHVWAQRLE